MIVNYVNVLIKDTLIAEQPQLTNSDNEVAFTTGDIKSVLANIAHQEGLSEEFITPQMLQGGRGPFNVTVSEDLGKYLAEEEEVELIHCL